MVNAFRFDPSTLERIVVGTAGHVDHGKTLLVKKLTGIDCDRLAEEKARGITIDLGFAHRTFGSLQVSFVDVPGHCRFLDNALAGLGGIRVMLLVVAANEGVMLQTREHLAIASMIGIPTTLVALTKIDLVEVDLVDVCRKEVEELLAGTPYAAAPVVPISSVTGEGLAELEQHLVALCHQHRVEPDASAPVRLPIDRAFHLQGRGVAVTGTLLSGIVHEGDRLEVLRLGRRFRVRSIQVHGSDRNVAVAGERASLLLAGADLAQFRRGLQLLSPGAFELSRTLCANVSLLADAPAALRTRTQYRLHLYSDDVIVRLSPLEPLGLEPGASAFVKVRLREGVPVVRGDRFLLRQPSPAATLGGGEVIDPQWHRRCRAIVASDLARLCSGSEERLLVWIERAGPAGLTAGELAQRLGVSPEHLDHCLSALVTSGRAHLFPERHGLPRRWIADTTFAQLRGLTRRVVSAHFEHDRFSIGMCKRELTGKLLRGAPEPLGELVLRKLVSAGTIQIVDGRVTLPGRQPDLDETETRCLQELLSLYRAAGLEPPTIADVSERLPLPRESVEGLVRLLVARRQLYRLPTREVIAACAVERLQRQLLETGHDRITVPELRDLLGLTRKWVVPLLELCDTLGFTRKLGMDRLIVKPSASERCAE